MAGNMESLLLLAEHFLLLGDLSSINHLHEVITAETV